MSEVVENERLDHQAGPVTIDYDAQEKEDDKKYATQNILFKLVVLSIAVSRTDRGIILRPCFSVLCTRICSIHCLTIRGRPLPNSIEGRLGRRLSIAKNRMRFDEALSSGIYPDGGKRWVMTSILLCV